MAPATTCRRRSHAVPGHGAINSQSCAPPGPPRGAHAGLQPKAHTESPETAAARRQPPAHHEAGASAAERRGGGGELCCGLTRSRSLPFHRCGSLDIVGTHTAIFHIQVANGVKNQLPREGQTKKNVNHVTDTSLSTAVRLPSTARCLRRSAPQSTAYRITPQPGLAETPRRMEHHRHNPWHHIHKRCMVSRSAHTKH